MSSGARNMLVIAILAVLALIALFAFGIIDVDQTKEARLPDVKVEAEGGQLPGVDVDTADVSVGTTKETIELPEVDVKTKKETVELPSVDVKEAE